MSPSPLEPGEVRPFGDTAALVGSVDAVTAGSVASRLREDRRAGHRVGLVEALGGARSLLVVTRPDDLDPLEVAHGVADACARGEHGQRGQLIELDVCFDGEDLELVGQLSGLGPEGVVEALEACRLEVAFLGFAPGFGYLSGLPAALASIPRRSNPRSAVPAGSLAVAAGFAAVYPTASPGGWNLVGRTTVRLFDEDREPYALLAPGDRVVLRRGPADPPPGPSPPRGPSRRVARGEPGAAGEAGCGQTLVVEDPGLATLIQDGGRGGWGHLGVPTSGPADPLAHGLANRLVGNSPGAAAFECTVRGPALRAIEGTHVAVVGGSPVVTVEGWEVPTGRVVPASPGQVIRVGDVGSSARTYLAVAGGVVAPLSLGSAAADSLSGLGSPPLRRGVSVSVGAPPARFADHLTPSFNPAPDEGDLGPEDSWAQWAPPWALRIVRGPHDEWFPAGALEEMSARPWVVSPTSNRVGLRLEPGTGGGRGVGGAVRRAAGELDPQGMVTGAIQVPPNGQPVILMVDHATHGGYPVIGVVISADRSTLGRARAGDELRLVPVTTDEARTASRELSRQLATATVGSYPRRVG